MFTKETTEAECREFNVPYFNTKEELFKFIESLDELNNGYGTAAYAMSLAATAAFNYIAHRFGTTGFQSSCADLDIIRRTRLIKGPFMLIKLEDYLYPQNNVPEKLQKFISNQKDWIKEEAKRLLKESEGKASPNVIAHWEKLSK